MENALRSHKRTQITFPFESFEWHFQRFFGISLFCHSIPRDTDVNKLKLYCSKLILFQVLISYSYAWKELSTENLLYITRKNIIDLCYIRARPKKDESRKQIGTLWMSLNSGLYFKSKKSTLEGMDQVTWLQRNEKEGLSFFLGPNWHFPSSVEEKSSRDLEIKHQWKSLVSSLNANERIHPQANFIPKTHQFPMCYCQMANKLGYSWITLNGDDPNIAHRCWFQTSFISTQGTITPLGTGEIPLLPPSIFRSKHLRSLLNIRSTLNWKRKNFYCLCSQVSHLLVLCSTQIFITFFLNFPSISLCLFQRFKTSLLKNICLYIQCFNW